jgi:hypothetical protein
MQGHPKQTAVRRIRSQLVLPFWLEQNVILASTGRRVTGFFAARRHLVSKQREKLQNQPFIL